MTYVANYCLSVTTARVNVLVYLGAGMDDAELGGVICQKSPDDSHLFRDGTFAVCTCSKSKQRSCLEVSRGGYRNFW